VESPLEPRAALVAGLLALLAVAPGCGEDASSDRSGEPPPARVELLRVEPTPLRNIIQIPGQLVAEAAVMLRPEIDGILASIDFEEGQKVRARDVLFRLRDDEQRARLAEAEAELALAEATFRRTRSLAKRDVSSEAQLERAQAERGVSSARVERARVALERTRIRAPFDGVMGALLVAPGDPLTKRTDLVRIDALDRVQLEFSLPEVAVAVAAVGAPVSVRVAPYPGEAFPGEVYFVSPTLDPATRRVLVKAWLPNPGHRLRPGLFAQVEAEIGSQQDALLVPESALVYSLDGTHVWRVDGESRAERVDVEVGLRREGRAEIRSGLRAGDVVVAAGIHKVVAGARVQDAGAPQGVESAADRGGKGPAS
jgi:membrane fusion protein (multidrug efflux system)